MLKKRSTNIVRVMFAYWILVIIWQTARPVANRSLIDTLVKMILFSMVAIYGYNHRNRRNTYKVTCGMLLFLMSQMITVIFDQISGSSVITVVFMFLEIIIFLIWLRNEPASYLNIIWFGQWLIRVAVIMAIYNIVFNTRRFLSVFIGSGGAYGNESKSFLYSNHEFALYLSAAIIFSVWFLISKRNGWFKTILLLVLLGTNLMSTYSRTAIIGVLVAVFVLMFSAGTKYLIGSIITYGVGGVLIFSIPKLNYMVFSKILKDSYENSGALLDAGRSSMYIEEWQYFRAGSFFQKIFGHGYVGNKAGGHDAYLTLLNIGGVIMFGFFVAVILWAIQKSFYCMRRNREIGSLMLGMQIFSILYMFAQTPILFFSTMDSYFITVLSIMLPLYTSNFLEHNKNIEHR